MTSRPKSLLNPDDDRQKFDAVLARFQDHTEVLRALTNGDLQLFGGYITLQLGVTAWIAEHSMDSVVHGLGLFLVDLSLAVIAHVLLRNNWRRRREIIDNLGNTIAALRFREPNVYLEGASLDNPPTPRLWYRWYRFGIWAGFVGFVIALVA